MQAVVLASGVIPPCITLQHTAKAYQDPLQMQLMLEWRNELHDLAFEQPRLEQHLEACKAQEVQRQKEVAHAVPLNLWECV